MTNTVFHVALEQALVGRAELASVSLTTISAQRRNIAKWSQLTGKSIEDQWRGTKTKRAYPALPPPPERAAGATGRGWALGKLRRKFPGWLKCLCGGLATIAGPWTTPTAILVSP